MATASLFQLWADELPSAPPFVPSPGTGALVTFEGLVRDENEGRRVSSLEYSAYEALAVREGSGIVAHAITRFALLAAGCAHRVGRLSIGDAAVRVWVAAAHRQAAFSACAFIIDAVKERVPIWKHETYVGGERSWVACQHHVDPVD